MELAELERKAAAGDSQAQFLLSQCLEEQAITPDEELIAHAWLKKSASRGFAPAQCVLGTKYLSSDDRHISREGMALLQQSASQGHLDAIFELGEYHQSEGHPECVEFYRNAANGRHVLAQLELAKLFTDGIWLPKNDHEAFNGFLRSAHQGESIGVIEVGRRLTLGEGTPKDLLLARIWLTPLATPSSTTDPDYMYVAQMWLSVGYAENGDFPSLKNAYAWINLSAGYAPSDGYLGQVTKPDVINLRTFVANRMNASLIQEAQGISAELYLPIEVIRKRCLANNE